MKEAFGELFPRSSNTDNGVNVFAEYFRYTPAHVEAEMVGLAIPEQISRDSLDNLRAATLAFTQAAILASELARKMRGVPVQNWNALLTAGPSHLLKSRASPSFFCGDVD